MTTFTRPSVIIEFARTAKAAATRLVQPTVGTIRDGYEPSQVVTRQQFNWMLKYCADWVGWMMDGVDSNSRNVGVQQCYQSMDDIVSNGRHGMVYTLADPLTRSVPWQQQIAASPITATCVWTDGAVLYYVDTTSRTYGSARRDMTIDADLDWSYITSGAALIPHAITSDGVYLYVTVDDTGAGNPQIWKLNKTTGATVGTTVLSQPTAATKIVSDGQYLAVMAGQHCYLYNTNFTLKWMYTRPSACLDIAIGLDRVYVVGALQMIGGTVNVSLHGLTLATGATDGKVYWAATDMTGVCYENGRVHAVAFVTGVTNYWSFDYDLISQFNSADLFLGGTAYPMQIIADGRYLYVVFRYGGPGSSYGISVRDSVTTKLAYIPVLPTTFRPIDCDGSRIYMIRDGDTIRYVPTDFIGRSFVRTGLGMTHNGSLVTHPWGKLTIPV